MSQIYKPLTSGGPIPPNIPTSFVTDNGTVVAAVNIVNINSSSTTSNNTNGITVIANPNGSNNEIIELTNRLQDTLTTNDGTPTAITTFALGSTPGTYNFDIQIAGFDLTDVAGVGYFISGAVRTTGVAAILIGTPDKIVNEEAATIGCDANLTVSGNNVIVQVTGLAGKTINWRELSNYIFVS